MLYAIDVPYKIFVSVLHSLCISTFFLALTKFLTFVSVYIQASERDKQKETVKHIELI